MTAQKFIGLFMIMLSVAALGVIAYLLFGFPAVIADWEARAVALTVIQEKLVSVAMLVSSFWYLVVPVPLLCLVGGGYLAVRHEQTEHA